MAKGKSASKTYCERQDFGMPVDQFVAALDAPMRALVESLRAIIRKAAPQAVESIKWGMPVYTLAGMLCYVQACKGYVRFGFYQGIQLDDREKRLEGSGEGMRHVKIRSADDIRPAAFARWVKRAVAINLAAAAK